MRNLKYNQITNTSYGKIKSNMKGITLTALVITIIIMLILVVIVIRLTLGKRGVFNTTLEAKEQTEKALIKEIIQTSYEFNSNNGYQTLDFNKTKASIEENLSASNYNEINVQGFPEFDMRVTVQLGNNTYIFLIDEYGNITEGDGLAPQVNSKKTYICINGDQQYDEDSLKLYRIYDLTLEKVDFAINGENEKPFNGTEAKMQYIAKYYTTEQLKDVILESVNEILQFEQTARTLVEFLLENRDNEVIASFEDENVRQKIQQMINDLEGYTEGGETIKGKLAVADTIAYNGQKLWNNKNIIQFSSFDQMSDFIKHKSFEIAENSVLVEIFQLVDASSNEDEIKSFCTCLANANEKTFGEDLLEAFLESMKEEPSDESEAEENELQFNEWKKEQLEEIDKDYPVGREKYVLALITNELNSFFGKIRAWEIYKKGQGNDIGKMIDMLNMVIPFVKSEMGQNKQSPRDNLVSLLQTEVDKYIYGINITLTEDEENGEQINITEKVDIAKSPMFKQNLNNIYNALQKFCGFEAKGSRAILEIEGYDEVICLDISYHEGYSIQYQYINQDGVWAYYEFSTPIVILNDTKVTITIINGEDQIYKFTDLKIQDLMNQSYEIQ